MHLVIDVGNTNIKFGLYVEREFKTSFIMPNSHDVKEKDLRNFIIKALKDNKVTSYQIDKVCYSSVVPKLKDIIVKVSKFLFNIEPVSINNIRGDLSLNVKNPNEVGEDILCGIYGVICKNYYPCVIVDLGTANKFLYVDENKNFSSCLIAPGMNLSVNALINNASLLKDVTANNVTTLLESKDTVSAISNGALYSNLFAIKGIVEAYEKEVNHKLNAVITGLGSDAILDKLPDNYIKDNRLILDALNEYVCYD